MRPRDAVVIHNVKSVRAETLQEAAQPTGTESVESTDLRSRPVRYRHSVRSDSASLYAKCAIRSAASLT